jgi:predicted nucleic acid-binding protein
MSAVLVDSNVLLDLTAKDSDWLEWSARALEAASDRFRLVINAVIYGEVSVRYSRIEDLDLALPEALFEREELPYEAAFLAGKAFRTYRRRGGTRRSPLPDFLIGAHAAIAGYQLLTRDVGNRGKMPGAANQAGRIFALT